MRILPLIALLAAVIPASAIPVQYNTIGSTLSCSGCTGTGSSSVTFASGGNTVNITYTPRQSLPFVNAPSNANFGELTFSSGATSFVGFNATLNLLINQALPTFGSGSLVGQIKGQVQWNANTGQLEFTPSDTITIGQVTYQLDKVRLVAPSTGGVTTIQGYITAVPEPSLYILSTVGLIGLLTVARKRKSNS